MTRGTGPDRRVGRMLRCYPPAWRDRYGDEFAELLAADLQDRPRSWRRDLDLIGCAARSRLAEAGLAGDSRSRADRVRADLAVMIGVATAFLVSGSAVWAQLTIGWQWAEPRGPAVTAAMVVMSGAVAVLAVLGVLATVPMVGGVAVALVRQRQGGLVGPLLLAGGAAAFFVTGAGHLARGWPGTGGHPWVHQGLVPGGVASFAWAATLSVTSYWAHPGALAAFPATELVWMAFSPLALAAVVVGAVKVVRRVELTTAVLRFEAWLATAAALTMLVFSVGAALWVVDGGPAPRGLFRTGLVDVAALVVMVVAFAVAWPAASRARLLART